MIVFLLLIIIAILLFGSGMILGVIGFITGFIAFAFAIAVAISIWEGMGTTARVMLFVIPLIGVPVFTVMAVVMASVFEGGSTSLPFTKESRRMRRIRADLAAEEARIRSEKLEEYGPPKVIHR